MFTAFCTDDDVFTLGLAAQAFVVRPRPVRAEDVQGATGTIRLKAHGLTEDDVVTVEVTPGGSPPSGVTAFAPLYPIVVSFDLFKLSSSAGGAALTFASPGSGWGVAVDPLRRIRRHAVEAAAQIVQHLTAHGLPLEADEYPEFLVGLNARMAARAAVTSLQIENAAYRVAVDRLFAREEFDKEMLDRLVRDGWPVKAATEDLPRANLSRHWGDESRGWEGSDSTRVP